jgi:hypothetical protein
MAIYSAQLTIPPRTPESSPAYVLITPLNGLLQYMEIIFPNGPAGVVGVRVLDEGRQIAPIPSGWIFGNDDKIPWHDGRRLQGPPYRVIFQGFSNAIDWPHTINLRLEIV